MQDLEQYRNDNHDVCLQRTVPLIEALQHPLLRALFTHWLLLTQEEPVPRRTDLDYAFLLPIIATTMLVDVRGDDAKMFRVVLQGHAIPHSMRLSHGQRIGDLGFELMRPIVIADCQRVKGTGTPLYRSMVTVRDHSLASYDRLILPFSENRRDVTELLVSCAMVRNDDLIQRLDARHTKNWTEPVGPDPRGD